MSARGPQPHCGHGAGETCGNCCDHENAAYGCIPCAQAPLLAMLKRVDPGTDCTCGSPPGDCRWNDLRALIRRIEEGAPA